MTHVLNTAEGSRMGTVDTSADFYRPFGIKYKGLQLLDVAQTNIAMYFQEVAEFIDEALSGGGRYVEMNESLDIFHVYFENWNTAS